MRKPFTAGPSQRRAPPPSPVPDAESLRNAALRHLARYAATEAGLSRVLNRRVERWARTAEATPELIADTTARARAEIIAIVQRLADSGALSDAEFARSRARSLARAGRSSRAIGAHLANSGVSEALATEALPENPERELAAALIHARKRRMGPWRKLAPAPELTRRELASFARAGFAHDIARRALRMHVDEAEETIIRFRAAL